MLKKVFDTLPKHWKYRNLKQKVYIFLSTQAMRTLSCL